VSISSCDGSLSPSDEEGNGKQSGYGRRRSSGEGHGSRSPGGGGGDGYSDEDLESEIRSINGRSAQRRASADSAQSSPAASLDPRAQDAASAEAADEAADAPNATAAAVAAAASAGGGRSGTLGRRHAASGAHAPNSKMFLSSVRGLAGHGSAYGSGCGSGQSRHRRDGSTGGLSEWEYPGIDLDESAEFDDNDDLLVRRRDRRAKLIDVPLEIGLVCFWACFCLFFSVAKQLSVLTRPLLCILVSESCALLPSAAATFCCGPLQEGERLGLNSAHDDDDNYREAQTLEGLRCERSPCFTRRILNNQRTTITPPITTPNKTPRPTTLS
jgi:hypothetical protein